jgi:pyrroline-5-carboxylate reductase
MALGKKIAFVGSGNMAEALVKGLVAAGRAEPGEIVCADPRAERREELEKRYRVATTGDNSAAVAGADLVILSV